MTIKEIIENGVDGQVIPFVTATVENVYPMASGTTNGKDWTVQNIKLTDETGQIRASVWGKKDMTNLQGHTFTFTSKKSDKRGLTGISVKAKEYKGTVSNELHITSTCGATKPKDNQKDTTDKEEPKSQKAEDELSQHLAGEVRVKAEFYKNAKLHAYAISAAMLENEWMKKYCGNDMTPELFQASVASIFIETCKRLPQVSPAIGWPEKVKAESDKSTAKGE